MVEDLARHRGSRVATRGRLVALAASVALVASCVAISRFPAIVERPFATALIPAVTRVLSAASGLVPVSVFELGFVALVARALLLSGRACRDVARGGRRARNAVAAGAFDLAVTGSVVLALFLTLFGIQHARPEIGRRLGWAEGAGAPGNGGAPEASEVAALCEELVIAANESYRAAVGSDDAGAPSAPEGGLDAIDASLERAYARLAPELGFEPAVGAPRARAKPVLGSVVLAYLDVGGFYSPWTGEANYNRLMPACTLPHTIAHEKAHQRGIAAEDEANFVGFLAASRSDHAYARYSAYLFAAGQVLQHVDPGLRSALAARRARGVERDLEARRAFLIAYHGRLGDLGRRVNDAYLKAADASLDAASARAGVRSYGVSVRWLVAYARRNGGRCVAPLPR